MFVGNYTHSVDDKGRFIMPSKYREQLGGQAVVTKGMDKNCLYLFHMNEWESLAARLRVLPNSRAEIRALQRHFITEAEHVDVDRQGRCLISAEMRAYAGIHTDVKLNGIDTKIEIWSLDSWNAFQKENTVDIAAVAGSLDLII